MSNEHMAEREGEDFEQWTSESSNIDREWALLNGDLETESEISAEDMRLLEVMERRKGVIEDIHDKLRTYSPPGQLVGRDDDEEDELSMAFFEKAVEDRVMEEQVWANRTLAEHEKMSIEVDCLIDLYEEKEFQTAFLSLAANIAHAERYPEDAETSPIFMSFFKKQIQSLALACHGWNPNSAWQRLINDVSPQTEGLSFYEDNTGEVRYLEPSDEKYVDDAKAIHPEYKAESRKRHWLIREALKKAGIDITFDDEQRIIDVTTTLLSMLGIANAVIRSEAERIKRLDELWRYGRRLNLDDQSLSQIVDLYDVSYPPEV